MPVLGSGEAWPYLLQENLDRKRAGDNVWVGNAAMSGSTIGCNLAAMICLPLKEMRIDAVIVLAGVDDLGKRLFLDESYRYVRDLFGNPGP